MKDLEDNTLSGAKPRISGRTSPQNIIKNFSSKNLSHLLISEVDSPTYNKACHNLGINPEECQLVTFEQFVENSNRKDSAERKYKEYKNKVENLVGAVTKERLRLSNLFQIKRIEDGTQVAQHTKTISNSDIANKRLKKEQVKFQDSLQKEAKIMMLQEIRKRQKSKEIKERIKKAEELEKLNKEKKIMKNVQNNLKFEEKLQKVKELEQVRLIMNNEKQKKQMEDIENKEINRNKIEEEKLLHYRQKSEFYNKKLSQIKENQIIEEKVEETRRKMLLEKIEKEYSTKKEKGDKYLKMLVKDLQTKNEKKRKKIEDIRRSKEELENKMTKQFKKVQSSIFSSILHNKHNDLIHFKIRSIPGTIASTKSENSVISSFRSADNLVIDKRTQKVIDNLKKSEERMSEKAKLLKQEMEDKREKREQRENEVEENNKKIKKEIAIKNKKKLQRLEAKQKKIKKDKLNLEKIILKNNTLRAQNLAERGNFLSSLHEAYKKGNSLIIKETKAPGLNATSNVELNDSRSNRELNDSSSNIHN